MGLLPPEFLLEVQDATEAAFQGVEFETVEGETNRLISGSARHREVLDSLTGESVVVVEGHGLFRRKDEGELEADHILVVQWPNGTHRAVSLDSGEIVHGDNDTDPEVIKSKILKALGAASAGII
jgi:hypothetical protein